VLDSATPNEGISFGRMVFIPPEEFQRLVASMPRRTEAVLMACGGSTPY